MEKHIKVPMTREEAKQLKAGDYVYLTGTIYTARDAAHKRMQETLQRGEALPLEMKENVIYYMGPSPAREGRPIGSAGPTTASRMDKYAPELLDLGLGKCRMCVAGKEDYVEDKDRPVRVATKFTNIAKEHYAKLGRDIDIIKLNGSIELAPILGLSDVIVDIVESGSTIRENHLKVLEEFLPISARFIANKSSFEFKNKQITEMAEKLKGAVEAHQKKKEQEKKEKEAKEIILKNSKDFNGTNTDSEVIKIAGISRNSYYKYKAELKEAAEQ